MRTVQLALLVLSVAALGVTAVAFFEIVLAPAVHGAPVRVVQAQAGPYPVRVALYQDPILAGAAVPFDVAVPGARGPLTYQVTATPAPGVAGFPYSVAQADVDAAHPTPYGVPGTITLVTRGRWMLHVHVGGSAGKGEATIPLTATAPPAMPPLLAWALGLVPLYGLVAFWIVQTRRRGPR